VILLDVEIFMAKFCCFCLLIDLLISRGEKVQTCGCSEKLVMERGVHASRPNVSKLSEGPAKALLQDPLGGQWQILYFSY
jgi:hypothetical protein